MVICTLGCNILNVLFRLIRLNQLSWQVDDEKKRLVLVWRAESNYLAADGMKTDTEFELTSLLEEAAIMGGDLANISFN